MSIERAVVTGASGFVGSALAPRLAADARRLSLAAPDWEQRIAATPWEGAVVLHLAAKVHHASAQSEADYQLANVEKTRVLAQAAARGGARRFVFLSSIKVNGEVTRGRPFGSGDAPDPQDAYARSKRAAETAVAEACTESAMTFTIVRVPLVYGPGARGNLAALLRLCDTPWPLPFGAVHNRRSFIDVTDVAALLAHAAADPRAAGRTFLAAYGEPVSTSRLVATIRRALGRPPRLVGVPPAWLRAAGRLTGRGRALSRLTEDLEVDTGELARELGWRASTGIEPAVAAMVAAYRRSASP